MELLQKLQNQIESLKANPADVNIDQLSSLLLQAYDLARDGLERSQNAALYLTAKQRIEELEPQMAALKETNADLVQQNKSLEKNSEALQSFADHVKSCTLGKIELLSSASPEMKKLLTDRTTNADYKSLVDLVTEVESSFSNDFKKSSKTLEISDKKFVNSKLYEI